MNNIDIIIEGLNQIFNEKYPNKGHFVGKTLIEDCSFKLYRKLSISLYFIYNGSKQLITTIDVSGKAQNNDISKLQENLCIKFAIYILQNLENLLRYGIQ